MKSNTKSMGRLNRPGSRLVLVILLSGACVAGGAQAVGVVPQPGNETMKQLGLSMIGNAANALVVSTTSGTTAGTIYYIDPNGSDSNNGTSQSTPWKTIANVNARTFVAGDMILFKAGAAWELNQSLHPLGSGGASAPIVIGAYGSGTKPRLSAKTIATPWTFTDGTTHYASDVVYLENQQHVEIRDLDISNKPDGYTGSASDATQSAMRADRRGIHIVGGNNTTQTVLQDFNLHDLYVHDVVGEAEGVSATGWDPSKRTAGILFEIIVKGANGLPVVANPVDVTGYQPTWFSNVTVQKNVLVNNSFGGVIVKQLEAWGARQDSSGPNYDITGWYPHQNIAIHDNYLDNGGSDYAADTVYLTCSQNASISHNVSHGAGTSAVELYYTDGVTVEWNEIYGATQKPTGTDSNAIDTDKATTNALVQYNYLHDNGDGILLCGFIYGSSVYRYNVIKDSNPAKRYLNIHGDKGNNFIYNNIFYNSGTSAATFVNSSGGSTYLNDANSSQFFYNNVFYSPNAASTVADGTSTTYDSNSYFNVTTVPAEDTHAIVGDPLLQKPTGIAGGASAIVDLDGLRLSAASPLSGTGRIITSHPNTNIAVTPMTDIEGNLVPGAIVDVGVYQNRPAITALTVGDAANAADWSIQRNIGPGKTLFGDRTFAIDALPALYAGGDWIRSANDSKSYLTSNLVTFTVPINGTVYVPIDDRITTKPSWLATWTDAGDNLTDNESGTIRAFSLYRKDVAANTQVTLGDPNSSTANNYAVIVLPVIAHLSVSDAANAPGWSVQSNVQSGNTLFGDRPHTIASLPSAYAGADWIRTANGSRAYTGTSLASFTLTRAATVYVAIDDRITTRPSWLSTWTDTGDNMTDNESGTTRTFSIYRKAFAANAAVSLGNAGSTTFDNYAVMVK